MAADADSFRGQSFPGDPLPSSDRGEFTEAERSQAGLESTLNMLLELLPHLRQIALKAHL